MRVSLVLLKRYTRLGWFLIGLLLLSLGTGAAGAQSSEPGSEGLCAAEISNATRDAAALGEASDAVKEPRRKFEQLLQLVAAMESGARAGIKLEVKAGEAAIMTILPPTRAITFQPVCSGATGAYTSKMCEMVLPNLSDIMYMPDDESFFPLADLAKDLYTFITSLDDAGEATLLLVTGEVRKIHEEYGAALNAYRTAENRFVASSLAMYSCAERENIPDVDRDAVPDNADDCIGEAGNILNRGCPVSWAEEALDESLCPQVTASGIAGNCTSELVTARNCVELSPGVYSWETWQNLYVDGALIAEVFLSGPHVGAYREGCPSQESTLEPPPPPPDDLLIVPVDGDRFELFDALILNAGGSTDYSITSDVARDPALIPGVTVVSAPTSAGAAMYCTTVDPAVTTYALTAQNASVRAPIIVASGFAPDLVSAYYLPTLFDQLTSVVTESQFIFLRRSSNDPWEVYPRSVPWTSWEVLCERDTAGSDGEASSDPLIALSDRMNPPEQEFDVTSQVKLTEDVEIPLLEVSGFISIDESLVVPGASSDAYCIVIAEPLQLDLKPYDLSITGYVLAVGLGARPQPVPIRESHFLVQREIKPELLEVIGDPWRVIPASAMVGLSQDWNQLCRYHAGDPSFYTIPPTATPTATPTNTPTPTPVVGFTGSIVYVKDDDIYRLEGDGTEIRLTNSPEIAKTALALSPRGDRVAYIADDTSQHNMVTARSQTITTLDLSGGQTRNLTDPFDRQGFSRLLEGLTWSPDGTRIAFTETPPGESGWVLSVVSANATRAGTETVVAEGNLGYSHYGNPAWSLDGMRIYTITDGCSAGCIRSYAADGQDDGIDVLPDDVKRRIIAFNLALSPDGTKLAFYRLEDDHYAITVYEFASQTLIFTNVFPRGDRFGLSWSPDSRQLIAAVVTGLANIPGSFGELYAFTPVDGEATDAIQITDAQVWSGSWQEPRVIVLPTAAVSESATPIRGRWTGQVNEGGMGYTTTLVLNGCLQRRAVCGTVEYSAGQCRGEIAFVSREGNTIQLSQERLSGICHNAYITLRPIDATNWTARYVVRDSGYGEGYEYAQATLTVTGLAGFPDLRPAPSATIPPSLTLTPAPSLTSTLPPTLTLTASASTVPTNTLPPTLTLIPSSTPLPTLTPTASDTPIPTNTPPPTFTPTAIATAVTCPGTMISRLQVGVTARVIPTGGNAANRIRTQATTSSGELGSIPPGGEFAVLEGPTCADGYAWWKVSYKGLTGWTAEGDVVRYWLEPLGGTAPPPLPSPAPAGLHVGGQAAVYTADEGLKLRAAPNTDGILIQNMPSGTVVTLLEGPVSGGDYLWWRVRAPDGNEGWVVESADGLATLIPQNSGSVAAPSCVAVTDGNVNLRRGPGTSFGIAGVVPGGSQYTVLGQALNQSGFTWYQFENDLWARQDVIFLQGDCTAVPVVR